MRSKVGCAGFCVLMATVFGSMVAQAFERGTDVAFRGTVQRVEQEGSGRGTMTVRINAADLKVRLNAETEIESHGNPIRTGDLTVGNFVQINGFFSTGGIVVREVHVFDDSGPEFRIRGTIESVFAAGDKTILNLPGGSVTVRDDTRIGMRGTDDRLDRSRLEVEMEVDARGRLEDGRFVATSIMVGTRTDDGVHVRFEGILERTEGNRLFIDTQGGGTAVVVFDDSTLVKGTLQPGQRVEVQGKLNEKLEVEAEWAKNDDAQADDHGDDRLPGDVTKPVPPPNVGGNTPVFVSRSIGLAAVAPSRLQGKAKIEYEAESNKVEQQLEVEIEDAVPGGAFQIQLDLASAGSVSAGTLVADSKGRAKARFSTKAGDGIALAGVLPVGRDVRDITAVRILSNGVMVLSGQF